MDTILFTLDQPHLLRLAFGAVLIALFAVFYIVAACAPRLDRGSASGHAVRIGRSLHMHEVEHA